MFSDLGAGAVKIGSKYKPENAPVSNITVKNNIIYKYGRIDRSAVGVLVFDSGGNTISHNEIFDGYYTGISVGWTWGFTPSHTQNNTIDFNKIHNLSFAQMCDLGDIYTLGKDFKQPYIRHRLPSIRRLGHIQRRGKHRVYRKRQFCTQRPRRRILYALRQRLRNPQQCILRIERLPIGTWQKYARLPCI